MHSNSISHRNSSVISKSKKLKLKLSLVNLADKIPILSTDSSVQSRKLLLERRSGAKFSVASQAQRLRHIVAP